MKLETRRGIFFPRGRRIEDVKDDGYIIILYSPKTDSAEWVKDEGLEMRTAEIAAEKTHLELMILSWEE